MAEVDDGYDGYYADRLWQLLPGVYRAFDSDDPTITGPLQELVARIGAQVSVVRRSVDRLWADQSIETCDDWVIPYIGDLLDANLVSGDARGQRLEVAKTIHYRRRKGTLAVLEEIARDVTGWEAHVVEAFRRLARTRHNLDPPVGRQSLVAALPVPCPGSAAAGQADPGMLLERERLSGPLTGTLAGGLADLRSAHGARLADAPFDEYFHTADLRTGQGAVGRYGIPKLVVFVWRLQSFAVDRGTPVPVAGSDTRYVFDPTGRSVPLFLRPLAPEPDDWADTWTSTAEWQVPGPLTGSLADAIADPGTGPPPHPPYPDVAEMPVFFGAVDAASDEPLAIQASAELGAFSVEPTFTHTPAVFYQYGFPAAIGAGPYDRTLTADPPEQVGTQTVVADGGGLDQALAASAGTGTVTIADSLTYQATSDVGATGAPIGSLLIRAAAQVRPVIRPAASAAPVEWVFTGGAADSELTIDGLLVSGCDVVLRGGFASVRLTGCTSDPGTLDSTGDAFASAADGRLLAPTRIWIEADPDATVDARGAIGTLTIDHCVLGPIRTRNGGAVESLTISDSIIQGIAPAVAVIRDGDVYDPELLARSLASPDPVAAVVDAALSAAGQSAAQSAITAYRGGALPADALTAIVAGLNEMIAGPSIFSAQAFAGVPLPPAVATLAATGAGGEAPALNLALLQAAYPVALSPAALAISSGTAVLRSVSALGRVFAHRLQATDSILSDFAGVEDLQGGCVRFSCFSDGSSLPSQYQSPAIGADAALFTSTRFGEPGYGQLLETADRAVLPGAASGLTITTGAASGSEMGAFSSQLAPIKEQGLLTKYGEYMPLGLTPVVVHVT